ncbi:MAG: redoxin family protein [Taibaiella sp.]|nr:redoxin family protein [Taibaiella sp.]
MRKIVRSVAAIALCACTLTTIAQQVPKPKTVVKTKTKTIVKTKVDPTINNTQSSATAERVIMPMGIMGHLPTVDMKLPNPGGADVRIGDMIGANGLLIMFSCNTCPFVRKAEAHTSDIISYAQAKGVGMIIVNSNEATRSGDDSPEQMVHYMKEHKYTVPYVIDPGSHFADMLGATHTPEVFLFNKAGNLVYQGAIEDNPSDPSQSQRFYVKEAIDSLLVNKFSAPPMNRSIGCSIKRIKS